MDFLKWGANRKSSQDHPIEGFDADGHMPLPSGDPPQTPESKGTGGLRGVFKSLTGGTQNTKAVPTHNFVSATSHVITDGLSKVTSPQGGIHGGPAENEKLFEQLKSGKTLAERKSAADGLRLALEGYPLSGVRKSVLDVL